VCYDDDNNILHVFIDEWHSSQFFASRVTVKVVCRSSRQFNPLKQNRLDLNISFRSLKILMMKTKFTWLAVVFLLASAATNAQTSKREFKINSGEAAIGTESKAYKNFRRSHPSVTNETWRSNKGFSFVSFMQGDIKNKIAYTPDGQVDYSLKMYKEFNLPKRVRAAVKSTYYDYAITNAQELKVKNKTIYLVKINNAGSWKTIRISNDDVEEIESYSSVISPCR
jgi:hypothetical protein